MVKSICIVTRKLSIKLSFKICAFHWMYDLSQLKKTNKVLWLGDSELSKQTNVLGAINKIRAEQRVEEHVGKGGGLRSGGTRETLKEMCLSRSLSEVWHAEVWKKSFSGWGSTSTKAQKGDDAWHLFKDSMKATVIGMKWTRGKVVGGI